MIQMFTGFLQKILSHLSKEFGVEIPAGWGALDVKIENTLQYKLKALSAHPYSSPRSEIAAVELNKLKHF